MVSPLEIHRVEKRRKDLWSEIKETQAKLSRLHAQYDSVENEKRRLVDRELQNIRELEEDQRASPKAPDDLMFDVGSEEFDLPDGFEVPDSLDWSFPLVPETLADAPSSSAGS